MKIEHLLFVIERCASSLLLPTEGTRQQGGAGPVHGEPSFASRMHWDHEPIRFGPRAVPARSGRARTRAWVIFQACWRGPHAATGDRSRSATSVRPTHGQRLVHGESPLSLCARIGTMNPPLTPPRRGTETARTDACSPPGRGRGWVGSWVDLSSPTPGNNAPAVGIAMVNKGLNNLLPLTLYSRQEGT